MLYLIVDGMIGGTGIRDKINGGFLQLDSLKLSGDLVVQIEAWLERYAQEKYSGYKNASILELLDAEGVAIARSIKRKLQDCKVYYFSDVLANEIFF